MLVLIKILTWFASPTGIFIAGNLLGVALLWKFRRIARVVIMLSGLQLAVFAMPLTAEYLLGKLEEKAQELERQNDKAQRLLSGEKYAAIVLLGGATSPANPPKRMHPDLGAAADRMWHATRLYKEGLAPIIIISGGRSPGLESRSDIQTEAQAMRLFLLDMGIPDSAMILEDQARTTRENASLTKGIIKDGAVALVTSAFHMPRALKNYLHEGLNASAYPTDFQVSPETSVLWARLLPNGGSLNNSEMALKEYLALFLRY